MDKASSKAVMMLPRDAAQVVLPDFRIDCRVVREESTAMLHFNHPWVWRRFVIQGQHLTVSDMASKILLTIDTRRCSLHPQSACMYLLQDTGKTVLTLFCPSELVFRQLDTVLQLSATTPYWVLPRQTMFQNLVDVATSIAETDKAAAYANIAPAKVAEYLAHIKPIYDHVLTLTTQPALLAYLTQLQADYLASRASATTPTHFAHTVHIHNAADYGRAKTNPQWAPAQDDFSACPTCHAPVAPDTAFGLRVAGATVRCTGCGAAFSQETIRLAGFYRDHATLVFHGQTVHMPRVAPDATYASYMQLVAETLKPLQKADRHVVTTILVVYLQRLDLVAAMARHLVFVSLICSNYAYWSDPMVLQACVVRYRQFDQLTLDDSISQPMPTIDIALVRFVQQTITRYNPPLPFYAMPSTALGRATAYAETFLLWADKFDVPYSSYPPSYEAYMASSKDWRQVLKQPFRKMKWERFHWVPSRDSRFVGVDEAAALSDVAVAVPVTDKSDTSGAVAAPTAAEFVAVIGTPLMDSRVQPPHDAILLKGQGSLYMSDPWTTYAAIDIGINLVYLLANVLDALLS
ncbi:Aste57867_9495 [Aphanomyces stellatus]|uniref:Aste57867_9495 protein n=1 Tax=Aphanomyces stellatus TaxID=120398 RepID=A0A485KN12_9STRA|nr:hypothetical protein As57867_009458 [Aphanomyces stellatus]VFT86374.1 Aste57867_9495 [Aphanomyces stellatus]